MSSGAPNGAARTGFATAVARVGARWVRILAASARMQILVIRSHPAVPITAVVQPVVFYVVMAGQHGGADSPAQRASRLIAILLTSLWGATLWAVGGILRREIAEGTLARNLTSLTDPRLVVIGKCLGSSLLVLTTLVGTSLVLALVTGARVPLDAVPWMLLGAVLVALSGTALGFALCSLFVLTRHAVHVTAALTYPVFILGGLLIPTSLIPGQLSWLSRLISLYWADQFLGRVAGGGAVPLTALSMLVLLITLYYVTGHVLFRRVVDRARRKGTIDLG
ncbi:MULTISPECIES: ABC transporter permease [Kitasatospora]|uniref:ABC-2 type transporter transmembrane domain-containing protein n=1 Tax=Kitasatospora cystarginea TaxID=58350 RepID=A0ABN3DKD9_9ACTN